MSLGLVCSGFAVNAVIVAILLLAKATHIDGSAFVQVRLDYYYPRTSERRLIAKESVQSRWRISFLPRALFGTLGGDCEDDSREGAAVANTTVVEVATRISGMADENVPLLATDAKASRNDDDNIAPAASQRRPSSSFSTVSVAKRKGPRSDLPDAEDFVNHSPISTPAGPLWNADFDEGLIPHLGQRRKRVLLLCTGGTLTMDKDPDRGNSLAPVQGTLTAYLSKMKELTDDPDMPEIVAHEYVPLIDSSDMGPGDWALIARDIETNYYHFDGFVILSGTDTMAYLGSALSFMLENLGKAVVITGSQVPLCEPYNDARKNVIMALIFACRDTIHEVTIFFHDRLLRACRATKVNTSRLLAFDSPNLEPLARIGITLEETDHLLRPPPRGAFRVHTRMETRLVTLRLVPGFDDAMMRHMIRAARETHLKGLILQLYGSGNLPSAREDFIRVLAEATASGVCVVACTQCMTGSVMMGHYATGQALKRAGVVSANDMTVEATTCKLAYLLGRGDLSLDEVRDLMDVNLRGEVTPQAEIPLPPLASTYHQAINKKNRTYRW